MQSHFENWFPNQMSIAPPSLFASLFWECFAFHSFWQSLASRHVHLAYLTKGQNLEDDKVGEKLKTNVRHTYEGAPSDVDGDDALIADAEKGDQEENEEDKKKGESEEDPKSEEEKSKRH